MTLSCTSATMSTSAIGITRRTRMPARSLRSSSSSFRMVAIRVVISVPLSIAQMPSRETQEGFLEVGAPVHGGDKRSRGPFGDDLSPVHDGHPLAQALRFLHVVCRV